MAIDRDADLRQHQPQRMAVGARRLDPRHRRPFVQAIEVRSGRKGRPLRRAEPRDPPALLIDQDRHIVAALQFAQRVGQRAQLRPVLDIAAEQDVAGGADVAEEGRLHGRQYRAGQAEDHGLHAPASRVPAGERQWHGRDGAGAELAFPGRFA